ncbi:MAG: DUF262 domain-containing protein, partial [Flavobacterium sp.]|uniref:DUF262 domain-containing protein n=1 Tax=Flavobacterium sp. TaxID=239 RepID=UPI00261E93A2
MNKEVLIAAELKTPVKIGDIVVVRGLGTQRKDNWGNTAKVQNILDEGYITIEEESDSIAPQDYKKWTFNIGANPFSEYDFEKNIKYVNFNIESILLSMRVIDNGKSRINWNPSIVNREGNKIEFQRGFCWSLEQKQLLINSIYKRTHIGSILVKKYWNDEVGDISFDIVDGKQRLNAIIEFYNNVYPDTFGNYFRDLSDKAQYEFNDFCKLTYGEISESVTD